MTETPIPDLDEIRIGDRVTFYGGVGFTLTTRAWDENHHEVVLTFKKAHGEPELLSIALANGFPEG